MERKQRAGSDAHAFPGASHGMTAATGKGKQRKKSGIKMKQPGTIPFGLLRGITARHRVEDARDSSAKFLHVDAHKTDDTAEASLSLSFYSVVKGVATRVVLHRRSFRRFFCGRSFLPRL